MEGNILLRLSESARRAVLKTNGDVDKQFAIRKVLSLMLWMLGEWQNSLDAKVKASKALEAIWDAVVVHIDAYLATKDAEGVNVLLTEMTRWAARQG